MAKYKDDLANGYVNGYYVGIQVGGKTPDKLADAGDDGFDTVRNFERIGTATPDAATPNYPEPLTNEEPEEPEDDENG